MSFNSISRHICSDCLRVLCVNQTEIVCVGVRHMCGSSVFSCVILIRPWQHPPRARFWIYSKIGFRSKSPNSFSDDGLEFSFYGHFVSSYDRSSYRNILLDIQLEYHRIVLATLNTHTHTHFTTDIAQQKLRWIIINKYICDSQDKWWSECAVLWSVDCATCVGSSSTLMCSDASKVNTECGRVVEWIIFGWCLCVCDKGELLKLHFI